MARSPPVSTLRFLLLFFLSSLLFDTVAAVNLRRCGVDTACFIDRCEGDDKNEWVQSMYIAPNQADSFRIYNVENSIDAAKCRVILQIKALTATRHVIFIRIFGVVIGDDFGIIISLGPTNVAIHEGNARISSFLAPHIPNQILRLERKASSQDLYDIRVETNSAMDQFDSMKHPTIQVVYKESSYSLNISSYEEISYAYSSGFRELDEIQKAMLAIRNSKTCTSEDFADFPDLSKDGYEVLPVDLSDVRLSCPSGFVLSSAQDTEKPIAIPEIVCENNQWQTDYINISDNGILRDFIVNQNSLRDDLGGDKWTFTMTDIMAIGCVQRGCSLCSTPPLPVSVCRNCTVPIVIWPANTFSCAELRCPNDHHFTFNGIEGENITPMCHKNDKHLSSWMNGKNHLDFLSCLYKPQVINPDITVYEEESEIESPLPQKPRGPRKNFTRKVDEPTKESSAAEWLRKNWISSILTPLIIIAVIGGCIVFLVFVLRTKDEQDVLLREERWRNRERKEAQFSGPSSALSTDSSRSEDALV